MRVLVALLIGEVGGPCETVVTSSDPASVRAAAEAILSEHENGLSHSALRAKRAGRKRSLRLILDEMREKEEAVR